MTTSHRNFHRGEAKLQAEDGIDTAAFDRAVDQAFQPELNDSEVRFINARTFSVAASLDGDGRPWASPLIASAGELFTVVDRTTVTTRPRPVDGDPLRTNLGSNASMGVLYFNPAIRRRAKSLGSGTVEADGSITYRMHRMFGLCPKYIFKRSHDPDAEFRPIPESPTVAVALAENDRDQLERADTIFLASHSEAHGTDPTHRGGPPGFVVVEDDITLRIPEYVGNGMFQTMGNLELDDRIGVLSVDFATGRIIQMTGRGSVHPGSATGVRTHRELRIELAEVRTASADVGQWVDLEPYPIPSD